MSNGECSIVCCLQKTLYTAHALFTLSFKDSAIM